MSAPPPLDYHELRFSKGDRAIFLERSVGDPLGSLTQLCYIPLVREDLPVLVSALRDAFGEDALRDLVTPKSRRGYEWL